MQKLREFRDVVGDDFSSENRQSHDEQCNQPFHVLLFFLREVFGVNPGA